MSGLRVFYSITITSGESIHDRLQTICLEQSAELPRDVIQQMNMAHVMGRPESIRHCSGDVWLAEIIWPLENIGGEISQFLNVLFGNISLMPGIRITGIDWNSVPENLFRGPLFGIAGIRKAWNIYERALSCTALKPMGSTAGKLAGFCYEFALGGIDIIKDDHGLANQDSAQFRNRVEACQRAVVRAQEETEHTAHYFPNITSSPSETLERAEFAAKKGCSGFLVCPHIFGLPLLEELQSFGLPLMVHPAFSGQLVTNPSHGFTIPFLYGQLWRALGADFSIYPNAGGRFSFSMEQCLSLNKECRNHNSPYAANWPTPGGGIQRETIPQLLQLYGENTVFLAGGSLYQHPGGIQTAAREFSNMLKPL